jgi:hypothetical protein
MFLLRRYDKQDIKTVLGPMLDASGNVPKENKNKVILSITNFTQEKNSQYVPRIPSAAEDINPQNIALSYTINVLVTAGHDDYLTSLDILSTAHYFFQAKSLFTPPNSPGLPAHIQKVSIEAITLNYQEMESLWTMLGLRYMPSVLYKVRINGTDEPVGFVASVLA